MRGKHLICGTMAVALVAAPGIAEPPATATAPHSPFTYTRAVDRTLQVEVTQTLVHGDRGYLPKDKNWVQVHLTVANRSTRTIQFTNVRGQLADGTVVASATSGSELAKPPSMGSTVGKTLGAGVAGQMLGMMIFPPLALLANAGGLFSTAGGMGSWKKRMERIDSGLLQPQEVAPGTSAQGDVYLPAAENQRGLLVFYSIDGRSESLAVARTGAPTAIAAASTPKAPATGETPQ